MRKYQKRYKYAWAYILDEFGVWTKGILESTATVMFLHEYWGINCLFFDHCRLQLWAHLEELIIYIYIRFAGHIEGVVLFYFPLAFYLEHIVSLLYFSSFLLPQSCIECHLFTGVFDTVLKVCRRLKNRCKDYVFNCL